MKLRQLSLFLENRPGALRLPCQVLGAAGIDISPCRSPTRSSSGSFD